MRVLNYWLLHKNCKVAMSTTEIRTVSHQKNYTCTQSTVCNIYCDESNEAIDSIFDCGQSEICNFYCQDTKCAQNSSIIASESKNLFVYVGESGNTARRCLGWANIYSPNNGKAVILSGNKSPNPFYGMSVHSGTNTKAIIIHANSTQIWAGPDFCKGMQVEN